jgi:hypothetical protein
MSISKSPDILASIHYELVRIFCDIKIEPEIGDWLVLRTVHVSLPRALHESILSRLQEQTLIQIYI